MPRESKETRKQLDQTVATAPSPTLIAVYIAGALAVIGFTFIAFLGGEGGGGKLPPNRNSGLPPTMWSAISPGGGGAFTSIGAGPSGTILVGSDLSGAYRSRDRGASWDVIGSTRGLSKTHISAVGFDPTDGNVMYLGSEGGLYRSGDGGDSWQSVIATGYFGSVTAARSNSSVVYASSHSRYNALDTTIYRSTNRGLTWTAVGTTLPSGLRILKLLVDAHDPNVVYALSGSDLFVAGSQVLFKSTDGAITWAKLADTLGSTYDVALDAVSSSTIYLTTYIPACGGTGTPACPPAPCAPTSPTSWAGCVYKSIDGGTTWTQKAAKTGIIFVHRDQPTIVRTIDVERSISSSKGGVWESTDSGNTWTQRSLGTSWTGGWQDLDFAYGKNLYGVAKTLGMDESDPNVLYWVDAQFVFAAFDGAQFTNIFTNEVGPGKWRTRGIDNVAVITIAQSDANPNRLYAGFFDLGFWRSDDGGNGWTPGNTPTFTGAWKGFGGNTTSIAVDPTRPDMVWATMGETSDITAVVRNTAGGTPGSWVATVGLPTGFIAGISINRSSPETARVLFVTDNGDVYRSQDDGQTWSLSFACGGCRTTAVDRFDGTTVYAGGEAGLFRSTASGDIGSWNAVGATDMTGTNPYPLHDFKWNGVHQIVPDPVQMGKVYVTAFGSKRGLFSSINRGDTWTKLRTCTYCRGVAVDWSTPTTLYLSSSAAYKGGGSASGSEGVLRSTDSGATWTAWNEGLAWPFAGPILVDRGNPRQVFVGAPGTGFFRRNY